jgi:hypothetical protein
MGGAVLALLSPNPYRLNLFVRGPSAIKVMGIAAPPLLRGPSTALGTAPIRMPGIGTRAASRN